METKKQKKNNSGAKGASIRLVAVLAAVLLAAMDVYAIVNMPQQAALIVIITLLLIVAVYVAESTAAAARREQEAQNGQRYGELAKSEKATYLLVKKMFAELSGRIEQQENTGSDNAQEVIRAQKAVAKISIGRNKENTDALMNSNDRVIEKIMELQDVFMENVQPQQEPSSAEDTSAAEILANQERIMDELEKLRALIMETAENMPTYIAENTRAQAVAQSAAEPESSFAEEMVEAAPELTFAEETVEAEPELTFADEPEQTEAAPEPAFAEEPELTEAVPAEETIPETPAPEPEKPPMPDLSDPNKVMTPEEIAALIANL